MNIYDKANELANALRETTEVKEYVEATRKVDSSESNRKMVDDFRRMQMEVYTLQMQGLQPSSEQIDAINNLWNIINTNSEVKLLIEAEMRFSKLWEAIMKILSEAIGINTNTNTN